MNLAPKTPYLCTFGQELKQNSCHIINQHPQICLIAKFHKKTKALKFRRKYDLLGYFLAGI